MRIINLILVLFTLILQSCDHNGCGECFTPPDRFLLEIVDKTSGENLFTNGTFDPEQIQITNTLTNSSAEFTFISEDNINLIQINSIGWETEIVNLEFDISDNCIFDFYVDAERKMGNCCSYTVYNEITIEESEFELDTQTGIYKILVE